jgi:hypothetical protein
MGSFGPMKIQSPLFSLLVLTLLASGCAAQKAPPGTPEPPAKVTQAEAPFESMEWASTGEDALDYLLVFLDSKFEVKVGHVGSQSVDHTVKIEDEALVKKLKSLFERKTKVETDSKKKDSKIIFTDKDGKCVTVESPLIKDESLAGLFEELNQLIRTSTEKKLNPAGAATIKTLMWETEGGGDLKYTIDAPASEESALEIKVLQKNLKPRTETLKIEEQELSEKVKKLMKGEIAIEGEPDQQPAERENTKLYGSSSSVTLTDSTGAQKKLNSPSISDEGSKDLFQEIRKLIESQIKD